jgi:hypothetical protein
VRFILEHSLSPRLAAALAALEGEAGHEVLHLRAFYTDQADDADTVWIPTVGRDHPTAIVFTADPTISRRLLERAAWQEARLTMFFLRSFADLPAWEQAVRLVKWWPAIVKQAQRARRGAGYQVRVNGKIESLEQD